ncbi:hypothetical protein RY27_11825 [Litorilinea aerophila]|nr:hypothetical protein RY27_11825 [Litorilinea aerophila]
MSLQQPSRQCLQNFQVFLQFFLVIMAWDSFAAQQGKEIPFRHFGQLTGFSQGEQPLGIQADRQFLAQSGLLFLWRDTQRLP